MTVDQQIHIFDFKRTEPSVRITSNVDVMMSEPDDERIAIKKICLFGCSKFKFFRDWLPIGRTANVNIAAIDFANPWAAPIDEAEATRFYEYRQRVVFIQSGFGTIMIAKDSNRENVAEHLDK